MELHEIRQLVDDLDGLLGLGGNFWLKPSTSVAIDVLETPEQLQTLFSDLLVECFGMKVDGL